MAGRWDAGDRGAVAFGTCRDDVLQISGSALGLGVGIVSVLGGSAAGRAQRMILTAFAGSVVRDHKVL